MHIDKGSCLGSPVDGRDKLRTAVRINSVVASMIGYQHLLQVVALSYADGNAQHDAVAERHHRRLHVLVGIMSFWNSIGAF